jgi:hypothetical protein
VVQASRPLIGMAGMARAQKRATGILPVTEHSRDGHGPKALLSSVPAHKMKLFAARRNPELFSNVELRVLNL